VRCLPPRHIQTWGFHESVETSHGSLSSPPSRNLRNMTLDLQGCAGQYTLSSLVPRPLGQRSLDSPGFFPLLTQSYTSPGLLSPLLSIAFPCGPLSLPSCSYIAGCSWLVAQSVATCSRWFLAHRFFYPEDGGDMFLQNVGSHKNYMVLHPRRQNSSQ
jgi:hypothetical protein